jgi:hypothetical protein
MDVDCSRREDLHWETRELIQGDAGRQERNRGTRPRQMLEGATLLTNPEESLKVREGACAVVEGGVDGGIFCDTLTG